MKTVREEMFGRTTVRLLRKADGEYAGLAFTAGRATPPLFGTDPEDLWGRLCREVGRASPEYFGFDGARSRFLRMFPDGFSGADYQDQERGYKLDAKAQLDALLPLDRASTASPEEAASLMRAFSATNMLSQYELMRMKDLLTGPGGAEFVKGAAAFAGGAVKAGLAQMKGAARALPKLSWPMATYLPFLWRPAEHMYLKPEVTREFAERVGHSFSFVYDAEPSPEVYASLVDLAAETERETADLKPVDRIDVQSFIWVVGRYEDADAPAPPL